MIAGRVEMTPEVIAKGHTPARNSKLAATLRRKYANGELDSISKAAVAANAPSARTKMAETQRRQYATGERIVNEAMNSPEAHAKDAATMHRKYVAGELDMLKQQAAANTPPRAPNARQRGASKSFWQQSAMIGATRRGHLITRPQVQMLLR